MSAVLDIVGTRLPAIGLDELNARAGLQTRVDSKYLIPLPVWDALVGELAGQSQILQIEDHREQTYDTVYFDTAELRCYHEHLQRRRFTFKLRSRVYRGSNLHVFEVKMRDGRRNTVKVKTDHSDTPPDTIGAHATEFYREAIHDRYGLDVTERFAPALRNQYTRLTLASTTGQERTTVDHSLHFLHPTTGEVEGSMNADTVLVETKSSHGNGSVDRILWGLGARPGRISKYVVGITLVHQPGIPNRYHSALHRAFSVPLPTPQTPALGAPAPPVSTDDLPRAPRPPRPPRSARPPRPARQQK